MSSATGFASFIRCYLPKSPLATVTDKSDHPNNTIGSGPSKSRRAGHVEDAKFDRDRRYYELNDSWMLKSGTTMDPESQRIMDGGILRTTAVEQEVKIIPSMSTEKLVK